MPNFDFSHMFDPLPFGLFIFRTILPIVATVIADCAARNVKGCIQWS
jgi:hypothetical protein